jgi:hypothetical protein
MRNSVVSTTARALGALLALAVLLVGVPFALAMLGWPLPTSVPTFAQLREALSGATISDAVLVKGLTVICWLVWTQLALSVIVETRAWAQGRVPVSVPFAGLLQPIARRLVLSAMLVLGSARTAVPTAISLHNVVTASAVVGSPADTSPGPAPVAVPQAAFAPNTATAESAPPVCVVQPRDSLWSLAEAHLGDGYRWRELFDLNRGVTQDDGDALSDPDLIRPGWKLAFPAGAQGLRDALGDPTPTAIPAAPLDEPVAPTAATPEPTTAPDATAALDTTSDVAQPSLPPTSTTTDAQPASPATPDDIREAEDPGVPVPVGMAGVGLLAAGVVVTIDRLRRVQQRRRPRGTTIPVPDAATGEVEHQLRVASAASPTARLDVALRALSSCLASRTPKMDAAIEAVSVGGGSVEILLASAVEAPHGPFEVTAAGRSWTLPAGVDAAELASRRPAPVPALVSIGRLNGRELLIDLEAHPRTALVGERSEALALLGAMVLELATNRWADDLRIVVVGAGGPSPLLERVQQTQTISGALGEIEAESSALTLALREAGHPSTLSARLADVADGWVPTVVLVSDPSDPDLAALLLLAQAKQGIAVVVAGDPGVTVDRTITLTPGLVHVSPPNVEVGSLGFAESEISALNKALAVAASDDDGPEFVLAVDADQSAGRTDVGSPVALMTTKTKQAEVEVRVLGTPEVDGGKEPIDRKKSKELVVYLALHPDGVDEAQLKAALWPGQQPTSGSFNQTVSKARLCLGRAEDGSHHLPHVSDGRYRLGPSVTSDLRRLEAAFARAIASSADEVMDELTAALAAIRGVPFAGGTGYEWAHAAGWVARTESIAADAALLLSEWCYDRRDTAKALWAAGQGLLASPGDERLFRMRMRAHDLAGNPAGVESAMAELCRFVESLEPHDDLHPETVALYEELIRRRRRTG